MSSNRVNEVAKTLTAYAAIFAAITLVTGVYGMNFQHMPELTWHFGYAYAIGLMIAAAGGLWVSANLSVRVSLIRRWSKHPVHKGRSSWTQHAPAMAPPSPSTGWVKARRSSWSAVRRPPEGSTRRGGRGLRELLRRGPRPARRSGRPAHHQAGAVGATVRDRPGRPPPWRCS
jgi:hypothetical protein